VANPQQELERTMHTSFMARSHHDWLLLGKNTKKGVTINIIVSSSLQSRQYP
jgi:hypothetical protein